jgi:hypothetical protein
MREGERRRTIYNDKRNIQGRGGAPVNQTYPWTRFARIDRSTTLLPVKPWNRMIRGEFQAARQSLCPCTRPVDYATTGLGRRG